MEVDSRSVHSFIIGEHGDSEIVAWSSTNVSGIPVNDFCELRGHFNHEEAMHRIADDVKNSAYDIIEKKGATYYGIAMSVKRICECIMRDEKSILPISSMMHGEYGISDICLSMPTVVGREGVETRVPIQLNEQEESALSASAGAIVESGSTVGSFFINNSTILLQSSFRAMIFGRFGLQNFTVLVENIIILEEKMKETKEGIYDARQLGKAKMLILGIQHMFAMFGATILVPILVGGYFKEACGEPLTQGLTVAVTLFCAGVGTLIFHVCSKFKVPAFLGSSFAFLGGFYTVANLKHGMYATMSANDKVAYACGGIVVAGLLYLVVR